jgi:hypothetical protein
MQKNTNSRKSAGNMITAWNDNGLDANSMPRVLTVKEKMLLTSKRYLKGEVTPTDYGLRARLKTDHLKGIPLAL